MQNFQEDHHRQLSWAAMDKSKEQHSCSSNSTISNGSSSISSCSSFDTTDDASSHCSSSPNSTKSSLHDLSDLMSHLPVKRGLSKFYQGKSESFTSLARVMSVEDLPKKLKNPYHKMLKMKVNSKSYGGGLDNYKALTHPKPIISKKLSRGSSFSSSVFLRQRSFARSPMDMVLDQQNN